MIIGTPNVIAYAALFLWIPFTVHLFNRHPPAKATMFSVFGGVLFLPEVLAVDPPLLPPLYKTSIMAFSALCCVKWKAAHKLTKARPFRGIDLLFVLLLFSNVGTAVTNMDALVTGPVVRPGLVLYDSVALGIKDALAVYLPFLLGRVMLTNRADLVELTRQIIFFGTIYVVLALVEIRLSPQCHFWLYGYHQMDFSMTVRFGGYRPMIFMRTGMAVGMFMFSAALVAVARKRVGLAKMSIVVMFMVMLVLCKSTGAVIYGIALIPLVAFVRKPTGIVAVMLALLAISYPTLRAFDLFPADDLVEQAERINEERALSLWFRFDQEKQLLERALERPLFGWGGYDRNRIFDPATGEDLSVTDGDWAIQVGKRGLVGFYALYGLLVFPVVISWRRLRRLRDKKSRILLTVMMLVNGTLIVDLLPNGLFHCLPFFFSGALMGLSNGMLEEQSLADRRRRAERRARIRASKQMGASGATAPAG